MSGWCSMGDRCRFSHNNTGPTRTPGTPSGSWGQQTQRLPKDVCRVCFEPGHWGNECPNKGKGKDKDK
eukprot:1393802-Pyramimonas_sp.AAC.1